MQSQKRVLSFSVVFVIGFVVGGLSVALYLQTEKSRYEADVLTQAIANSAFSYVPTLLAVSDGSIEDQISQIEASARTQLTGGVLLMNSNMDYVSPSSKEHFERILTSIAKNREKLGLGQYASPPREDIEAILIAYSNE